MADDGDIQDPPVSQPPGGNTSSSAAVASTSSTPTSQSILSAATNLVKLKTDNYRIWYGVLAAFLRGIDLYKFVDGSNPCPTPTADPDSLVAISKWQQQDQLVLTVIYASLSDAIIGQVVGFPTSAMAWSYLHDTYAAQTNAQIGHLLLQLASIEKKSTESITVYYNRARALVDSLAITGHSVSNQEFQCYLLKGLPSEYSGLVSNVLTRKTACNPSQLYSFLLSNESCLDQQNTTSASTITVNNTTTSGSGGSTQGRGKTNSNRGRSNNSNRGRGRGLLSNPPPSSNSYRPSQSYNFAGQVDTRPTCQICKKKGHDAVACYHRYTYNYQPRPPSTFTVNATGCQAQTDWLPDSAASNHFTGDFSKLNLSASDYTGTETVSLGDGSSLPIYHQGYSHQEHSSQGNH